MRTVKILYQNKEKSMNFETQERLKAIDVRLVDMWRYL